MASEWRRERVADLQREGILLVEDGNHGEYRPRSNEFVPEGIAFIRAADMENGRVLFNSAEKINEEARQRITKGVGAPQDVLLSHKGTVGKVALVPDEAPPFVCSPQTTFWRTLNSQVLDSKYLFSYLRSPEFRDQLAARAGETDMAPYVSLTSQRGLYVAFPDINEQRSIVRILGALDDKIELNRGTNETLEAVTRAIFTSWFVDFDPVRAKANGEAPESVCRRLGLTPETFALFPDRFVDSELGEIPEGWAVASVYSIASVVYGAPFASATFNTEGVGIPLIRIRDLKDEMPGVYTEEVHPKAYLVRAGDIVVGMDGEFRAYLWGGEDAWLNQRLCVFKPAEGYSAPFVRNSIAPCLAQVEETETATTVIHLGKNDIDRFRIVVPEADISAEFSSIARALYARIIANKREARILCNIRDVVLPRLLSGELRGVVESAA